MAVKIGHASLGSNGKINGDLAGDQNGKEVTIREWYSKPWNIMLRPVSSDIAEKSAKACEAGCANNNIGYNQSTRNTTHTQAKKVGYDLSKIATPCETDCSAFMTLCAIAGGVTELEYSGNAPTTSTMAKAFTDTGKYKQFTDAKYLTSDKYLQRGDILVKPGSHTVMVLENGANPAPKSGFSYPCRGIDVAAWQTNLDYKALKQAGTKFAILKIIRKDGQPDKMFEKHYAGFISADIPILAVYNYSYAQTVERARMDAQKVLKILGTRKIPVCLDVEDKLLTNLNERLIQIINAYQKEVEGAGLPFILYTGLSFWNSYIKPYQSQLNCRNNWIARYYKGYNPMVIDQVLDDTYKPPVPNLVGWQFTSSLVIGGSLSRLDGNIIYKPFNTQSAPAQSKGKVTANTLNVRNAPNTDGAVVGYLKLNDVVSITGTDPQTGWYKIPQGWVSNKYISIL